MARERILASLKAIAAKGGPTAFTKDLIKLQSTSLSDFLDASGRSIEEFYKCANRTMSWSHLQRLAEVPGAPPQHTDADLQEEEAGLLRRVGFLQHMADGFRTGEVDELAASADCSGHRKSLDGRAALGDTDPARLGSVPADLQSGFDLLWRHPAVRAEVDALFELTHAQVDAKPVALLGMPDVPARRARAVHPG